MPHNPPPPNPGSPEALAQGCLCPVIDNCRGRGIGGQFWMNLECPLHGEKLEAGDNGEE